MINRELFGIAAQSVGIFTNPNGGTFVICKHDTEKLSYWNRQKQSWVDNIFEATLWPEDKPGETPYLKNNVYSRFEGFTAKGYKLVGISSGLYPCTIKFNKLYFKGYKFINEGYCLDLRKLVSEWTSDYQDCKWIQGPYEALDIMWELINNET